MMLRLTMTAGLGALMAAQAIAQPSVRERQVTAPGPQGALAGTLLEPPGTGNAPVVLMIPGSGNVDRDGNSPGGIKSADMRLLAEGLAQRGIATARIDKRGMFASMAAVPDANKVTMGDYASDALSWIASLRKTTGARCIWLLGHSEGGLVALAAAARDQSDVCGLILISAPGRPLPEILREQLHALPAMQPYLADADAAIDTLKAGKHVDVKAMPSALGRMFRPEIQGFLIDMFRYDPAALIAKVQRPVLIEQGERDLQVRAVDARRLAAADPRAKLVLLPDVNHVLKVVKDDNRRANIATYFNPDLPLAPGVVEAVADFVRATPAGG